MLFIIIIIIYTVYYKYIDFFYSIKQIQSFM